MTVPPEPSLLSGTDDPERAPGYPFRGPGLLGRVAPFAAIAVLAEVSLALTPHPASVVAGWVSVLLLLGVAAAFALPWPRLPARLTVLVPLAYTGSVLALILAAGTTSGVGIVILVPLVWTTLFHQRWESGCVVAAITTVEVIISLTPVTAPDAVTIRRVVLWAALGTVVAVATHGLRDRSHRARLAADRLQARLTRLTVLHDRDRIAGDLQDKVIQQVFAAGLSLQSAAMATTQPEVRGRILATANDLDLVIRLIRDTIFGLEQRLQGHGLRAELTGLAARLSPAPEMIFTGPVDGALDPVRAAQLMRTLKQALETITPHSTPSRIAVATSDTAYVAEIETPWQGSAQTAAWITRMENGSAPAGISLTIEAASGRARFIWSLPLGEQP